MESVRESSGTFTERTEKTFGITHLTLTCENDCPYYELPADGMKARWMKDNRLEHGEFVIDGSKVGLAGPDGTLLKEANR
ncbi:hypothetical protein JS541_09755 [Bifidobacterium sp. SO1]|nr:hypothetical protein [Bifidobacterium sp. SO1]